MLRFAALFPLSPKFGLHFTLGTVITKGTLRFGTLVEIHGIQSLYVFRTPLSEHF